MRRSLGRTPHASAMKRNISALAFPSLGGAATFTFNCSPSGPAMTVFDAPGTTRRLSIQPEAVLDAQTGTSSLTSAGSHTPGV